MKLAFTCSVQEEYKYNMYRLEPQNPPTRQPQSVDTITSDTNYRRTTALKHTCYLLNTNTTFNTNLSVPPDTTLDHNTRHLGGFCWQNLSTSMSKLVFFSTYAVRTGSVAKQSYFPLVSYKICKGETTPFQSLQSYRDCVPYFSLAHVVCVLKWEGREGNVGSVVGWCSGGVVGALDCLYLGNVIFCD